MGKHEDQVFLSYAGDDWNSVRPWVERLRQSEVSVW